VTVHQRQGGAGRQATHARRKGAETAAGGHRRGVEAVQQGHGRQNVRRIGRTKTLDIRAAHADEVGAHGGHAADARTRDDDLVDGDGLFVRPALLGLNLAGRQHEGEQRSAAHGCALRRMTNDFQIDLPMATLAALVRGRRLGQPPIHSLSTK